MSAARNGAVLVCGAGPTGLTMAIELARRGVEVEIVDGAPQPTTLSKAAAVWRRTLEVLHGAVPTEAFIRPGRVLRGIRLETENELLREVEFPQASRAFPHGLLLPQCDTERILTTRLEELGISVRRGRRLRSFETDARGVEVVLETDGGTDVNRYQWLIGADGAHSVVRHQLGIDFPGESIDRRWLLADFEWSDGGPDDKMRAILAGEGMMALFPYGGGRWRLVADGGPVEPGTPRRDPDRAEIEDLLSRRTGRTWAVGPMHWLSDFRVSERQVKQYRHGRVLLAGDAAHVHSPAGGQGMNTSIQDAVNLGWKLAMVIHGTATEPLLDTYDAERHPVAAAVLRDSGRMLRFAMNRGRIMRVAKRRILPTLLGFGAVQRHAIRSLSEVGVNYRHGPLAGTDHDRWIGRRCPDVPFGDAETVYDLLRDPRLCILELGRTIDGDPSELEEQSIWRGLDPQWHRIARPDGSIGAEAADLAKALHVERPGLVVIRPDGYLGPVGATIDRVTEWVADLRSPGAGTARDQ